MMGVQGRRLNCFTTSAPTTTSLPTLCCWSGRRPALAVRPDSPTADSAHGSAESLAWLVKQKGITPLIPVFDESNRTDGAFSRADFACDPERNRHPRPAGRELVQFSEAPAQTHEAAPRPRGQGSIAPANRIAASADSRPSAARTLLPARSREIGMKALATWPARTLRLQNTWRPAAVGRKSRGCSPISSGFCALRARAQGVRTEPTTSFSLQLPPKS
jgi:hypothetical protein